MNVIAEFVKKRRKQAGLTQEEFAMKAGVALRVVPKIEQGKDNLSLSRVNQVLKMFGHVLGPVSEKQLCDRLLQQNTTTFNLAYPK